MKIISSEKMTLLSNLLHNDEMAKLTAQLCNRYPHVQTGQTFDTVLAKVVELNEIYLKKKLCLPQSRYLNIELHFLLGWFYHDNPLYTEITQLAEYHGEENNESQEYYYLAELEQVKVEFEECIYGDKGVFHSNAVNKLKQKTGQDLAFQKENTGELLETVYPEKYHFYQERHPAILGHFLEETRKDGVINQALQFVWGIRCFDDPILNITGKKVCGEAQNNHLR